MKKSPNYYQKSIIIFMFIMVLFFSVIYPKTILRVGYRYNGVILVPTCENGNVVYSGKINGKQTQFVVSEDRSVILMYDDKIYGPYIVKEYSADIPISEELKKQIIGVEIYNEENILFRGGILDVGDNYLFYNDDGTLAYSGINYATVDGIKRDENGNVVDEIEPSIFTIYELLNNPELTHNGDIFAYFGAVFICILNVLSILFADELFRWKLFFWIQNVEDAEPSDSEMAGRYIFCTFMTIMALVIFVVGLQ